MSDSLRKFHNPQIENKIPIIAEIARHTDEFFARGGAVTYLAGPTFTPANPRPRTESQPKAAVITKLQPVFAEWNNPDEIELVRQLKTGSGLTNQQIAAAVNKRFDTGRSNNAIRGICRREAILRIAPKRAVAPVKVLGVATGPGGWEPREDALLRALTRDGVLVADIQSQLLAQFASHRTDSSIRSRSKRLGLTVNKIRSAITTMRAEHG